MNDERELLSLFGLSLQVCEHDTSIISVAAGRSVLSLFKIIHKVKVLVKRKMKIHEIKHRLRLPTNSFQPFCFLSSGRSCNLTKTRATKFCFTKNTRKGDSKSKKNAEQNIFTRPVEIIWCKTCDKSTINVEYFVCRFVMNMSNIFTCLWNA